MDWNDSQWLLWVGVAIIAGLVEVLTLDLIFLMIAGGGVAAAASAAAGVPLPGQLVVFALGTVVLLLVARPPLLRYSRRSLPESLMGTAALVGREAEVVESVSQTAGLVKLSGEVWTARAAERGPSLEVGSRVRVVRIDGATAVVTPVLPPQDLTTVFEPPSEGPDRGQ